MKYACLVYHDQSKMDALSHGDIRAITDRCGEWVEDLERGGHHVFSTGLQSIRTKMILKPQDGRLKITDGPFTETKEFLAGFTIIEARDLNEAVRLASAFPAATGYIELRPALQPGADLSDPFDQRLASILWSSQASTTVA